MKKVARRWYRSGYGISSVEFTPGDSSTACWELEPPAVYVDKEGNIKGVTPYVFFAAWAVCIPLIPNEGGAYFAMECHIPVLGGLKDPQTISWDEAEERFLLALGYTVDN